MPAFSHRKRLGIADDHMIQQYHVLAFQGIVHHPGAMNVLQGRVGACKMIVRQNYVAGLVILGLLQQVQQMDLHGRGGACVLQGAAQNTEIPIQKRGVHQLLLSSQKIRNKEGSATVIRRKIQGRALPLNVVAAADIGQHLKEKRCAFPHVLDVGELLGGGIQHVLQPPEALDQLVGKGIGVPLGIAVIENDLQKLVVHKAVRACVAVTGTNTLTVSLVDGRRGQWFITSYTPFKT